MLSGKPFFIVVMVCLAIILSVNSVSASEKELDHQSQRPITESEFRAQYKMAAQKFKSAYQNSQCRIECQYQFDDPNDLSRKKKYEFSAHLLMKGNAAVTVQEYAKETPRGGTNSNEVGCATPNYAFELYKTKPETPYLISSVTHISTQEMRNRMRVIIGDELDKYLCAAGSINGFSIESFLEKPSLTIVKLERFSSSENVELVALDFQFADDPWDITSAHIVFAPQLNWAVLEYHYRCDYSATDYSTYSGKNIYSTTQKNTTPFPEISEHHSTHYHADILPMTEHYSATLTDISIGTVDDSVFLLSHYGLPDSPLTAPSFPMKSAIQWFLTGNGVLLFLIVIGIVINRSRTTRSPEGPS